MKLLKRALLIAIALFALTSNAHAESLCTRVGISYPMPGHPVTLEVGPYCVPIP